MTSVLLDLAEVVGPLAAVVTAAGVVTGLVVLLATGRGLLALRVALELWTAAGLLRLGADAELPAILTAATVLGLRQLVSYAQRHPGEELFSRLKQFRRVATRYDKLDAHVVSFGYGSATVLWLCVC